jgi:plasmid stabilization system protein ParE
MQIEEACSFYSSETDGRLVARFLRAVDAALAQIAEYRESCPKFYRNTRRVQINRFPYSVYYRIENDSVVVLAVAHGKRSSSFLRRESE